MQMHGILCYFLGAGLGFPAAARKFVEVFGVTWAGSQLTKVQHLKFGLIKSCMFLYKLEVMEIHLILLKMLQSHRPFETTGTSGI